mmetsp:Transcript_32237/g.94245  ORF Transcript_32237/g.94245 Transcript_32237/m.94245 type:complete len:275 (-) Transcript_32237:155-979(-)
MRNPQRGRLGDGGAGHVHVDDFLQQSDELWVDAWLQVLLIQHKLEQGRSVQQHLQRGCQVARVAGVGEANRDGRGSPESSVRVLAAARACASARVARAPDGAVQRDVDHVFVDERKPTIVAEAVAGEPAQTRAFPPTEIVAVFAREIDGVVAIPSPCCIVAILLCGVIAIPLAGVAAGRLAGVIAVPFAGMIAITFAGQIAMQSAGVVAISPNWQLFVTPTRVAMAPIRIVAVSPVGVIGVGPAVDGRRLGPCPWRAGATAAHSLALAIPCRRR